MKRKKAKRTYDNSLREKQARETRRSILETLTEIFCDESVREFSMAELANRAGVSEPTLYRYFASRDILFDAWGQWRAEEIKEPELSTTAEGLCENVSTIFSFYDSMEELMRASQSRIRLMGYSPNQRRGRDKMITGAFLEHTGHLNPKVAKARAAIFRYLIGSSCWAKLTADFGVDSKTAAEAVQWTTKLMLDGLTREKAKK